VSTTNLRAGAVAVLEENHRDGYTVPAVGLYPYQWCWDSGPIALGWAAVGRWTDAWSELNRLMAAQWPSGMVPHIVFWEESKGYFPGPEVWGTHHDPPTTGITQPPLPISAAARLALEDPDRTRARRHFDALWPRLVAWLEWIARARTGPHGAAVVVHPWESGMDNSPRWDGPLGDVPESSDLELARRDVKTVSARQRPTDAEYRRYLGIVERLRDAGWDTERQVDDSPFAVEDVAFTAITARAASDLGDAGRQLGFDTATVDRIAAACRAGLAALWDADMRWFLPFDVRSGTRISSVTAGALLTLWARAATDEQAEHLVSRLDSWATVLPVAVPSSDPAGSTFDPERYWRGPVWVLLNWMIADGLASTGRTARAEKLRASTRALVERSGFCEYFDPRTGTGIGGQGFSWTAALTLAWLIV
jgi:hypothetical protein